MKTRKQKELERILARDMKRVKVSEDVKEVLQFEHCLSKTGFDVSSCGLDLSRIKPEEIRRCCIFTDYESLEFYLKGN